VHFFWKAPKREINFAILSLLESFSLSQDRSAYLPSITFLSAFISIFSLFIQKKDLTSIIIINTFFYQIE